MFAGARKRSEAHRNDLRMPTPALPAVRAGRSKAACASYQSAESSS